MGAREVEKNVQLGSHVLLGYYPITEGEWFGLSASNLLQYETSFSLTFNYAVSSWGQRSHPLSLCPHLVQHWALKIPLDSYVDSEIGS